MVVLGPRKEGAVSSHRETPRLGENAGIAFLDPVVEKLLSLRRPDPIPQVPLAHTPWPTPWPTFFEHGVLCPTAHEEAAELFFCLLPFEAHGPGGAASPPVWM